MTAIQKPGRYAGGEWNAVVKRAIRPVIALAFPDVYEIGMSHHGLRLLYEIVNRDPRFAAERVYAPWPDKAAAIRDASLHASAALLTTLETGRPIKEFDLLGVSLTYELAYPDLLEILDLGGIPCRASERGDLDPIVIAGGPCALHAAPVHPFLDAIFLGEADEAILEIMEAAGRGASRRARLEELAAVPGVKVLAGAGGGDATRRIFFGFGGSSELRRPVVPLIETVHDRVTVEIARGCTHGCRFCQAGTISRPLRYRPVSSIVEEAAAAIKATGHDEISLLALSACDHPGIRATAEALARRFRDEPVSISIPSSRVDSFDLGIHLAVSGGRRTGITLAPETATDRMDRVVNKGAPRAALRRHLEEAFANGWKTVKLYFMIGLPFETLEDAAAIGACLAELAPLARARRARIRASVSVFRPKPWTPFQWIGMERPVSLRAKIEALRAATPREVTLDVDDPFDCLVEAALARGDERIAAAVERAWRMGLTLQSWGERFDLGGWRRAFNESGLDLEEEACRAYSLEARLPWEDVEIGIDRAWLEREWRAAERASRGEATPDHADCSIGACSACGMPCVGTQPTALSPRLLSFPLKRESNLENTSPGLDSRLPGAPVRGNDEDIDSKRLGDSAPLPPHRVAFLFARTASASMIGHLDMMRQFERAFRRAGITLAVTGGFNPRPRLRFALSLPLGAEAEAEYVEVDLFGSAPPDFSKRMNMALPPGIRVVGLAEPHADGMPRIRAAAYRLVTDSQIAVMERLRAMMGETLEFMRKGRRRVVRISDFITDLAISDDEITFLMRISEQGGLPVSEVMKDLAEVDPNLRLVRCGLEYE